MIKIPIIVFLIIGIIAIYYIRKDKFKVIKNKMINTNEDAKIANTRGITLQEYYDEYGDGELMTDDDEKKVFNEWKNKKDELQENKKQVEIW